MTVKPDVAVGPKEIIQKLNVLLVVIALCHCPNGMFSITSPVEFRLSISESPAGGNLSEIGCQAHGGSRYFWCSNLQNFSLKHCFF